MAELADALDSGSSDFTVIQVQVLLSATKKHGKKDIIGRNADDIAIYRAFYAPKTPFKNKAILRMSSGCFGIFSGFELTLAVSSPQKHKLQLSM